MKNLLTALFSTLGISIGNATIKHNGDQRAAMREAIYDFLGWETHISPELARECRTYLMERTAELFGGNDDDAARWLRNLRREYDTAPKAKTLSVMTDTAPNTGKVKGKKKGKGKRNGAPVLELVPKTGTAVA